VVGLLTRAALVRAMLAQGPEAYIAAAMDRSFVRVSPDADLSEAFTQAAGACALVMNGDTLLGLLTAENYSEFLMLRQVTSIRNKAEAS
jgi:CBS domain-containing protein